MGRIALALVTAALGLVACIRTLPESARDGGGVKDGDAVDGSAIKADNDASTDGGWNYAWDGGFAATDSGQSDLVRISPDGGSQIDEVLARFDRAGNATVVWVQKTGYFKAVWASRFTADAGWGEPLLLDNGIGDAKALDLAVTSSSGAIVAWQKADLGFSSARPYASVFRDGAGWQGPTLLADAAVSAGPRVAADTEGGGVVAVDRTVRPYLADAGIWGPPVFFADAGVTGIGNVSVACDGAGILYLAWTATAVGDVMATRFVPGLGFEVPISLSFGSYTASDSLALVVDSAGNQLAVSTYYDGFFKSLTSRRFDVDAGTIGPMLLVETAMGNVDYSLAPQVDGQGNVVAAWMQYDENSARWLVANRFEPATGWGDAGRLSMATTGTTGGESLAVNGGGEAILISPAAWPYLFRFTPGEGWRTASAVSVSSYYWWPSKTGVALRDDGVALMVLSYGNSLFATFVK